MKKNFLKQLACVLSLAMVVTSVAPATTAVEAAKASSLNAKAATISVGGKFDINVKNKVKGTKYTYDYMYTAGKNYVTLNKKTGVVTGKKAGKATIKCIAKKGKTTKILKCVITVAPKATKVTINNAEGNSTIKVGDKFQFKATVTPGNAGKSTWSISDSSVFKVDKNNGYVRALKPGKATLTVTNGTVSDKVELTAAADYSATQAGAKTITVTSPVMLKESDLKVTKGSASVALADKGVKLSDDKLTAEITTSGRLVNGTYKVTLNSEKTLEFTAATEKVSKIELTSDKAALTASTSSTATVGYKVANQFGEDITKRTSVQISGSHNAKMKESGTIEFTKGSNGEVFNQNVDVVSVVVIHTETGITAQATLTVSAAKAVSEVTVLEGIYNEDGKELTGDSELLKDDYYVLFEAKDQYGGNMTDIRLLSKGSESPAAFVTVAGGLTKLTNDSKQEKTKKITKDGKDYAAVKLVSTDKDKDGNETGKIAAGTATVSVIGAGNGKQGSATITVKDGTEAVTLNVFSSDVVLAGNDNEFTFEATDAYGNAVTKYDVLKKIIPSNPNMKWEEDYTTGKAKLKYTADKSVSNDTPVVVTFQLTNYKVVQCSFTVKANAVPKTVTKVTEDVNTMAMGTEKDITIKAEHVKMETQYGNEISFDDMKASGYKLKIVSGNSDNVNGQSIGLKDTSGALASQLTVTFADIAAKDSAIFKISSNGATDMKDVASRDFELTLIDKDNKEVAGSGYTLTVSIYPQGKLTGYSVEDIKPIYVTSKSSNLYDVKDAFARDIKVTAKRSGVTVVIPDTEINVIGTSDIGVGSDGSDLKVFSKKDTEFKDGVTEIKQTIKVVVNSTGDTFEKEVILTNVDPKVTSVEKDKDVKIAGTVSANSLFANGNPFGFKVKTQYDNGEATVDGGKVFYKLNSAATAASGNKVDVTPRITFTDHSAKAGAVSNGTKDASTTLTSGQTVMVSLDFGNGQIIKFKAIGQ